MDDLPFEIKHMICASAMETGRETLQPLSVANHTWYQAAVPFLYERLQLCLTSTAQLQADVEQLLKHPLRKQYLRYLRRLDLVGRSGKQSLQLAALQEEEEGPIMLDNFLDRELWQRHTFRLCRRETTTPDYAPLAMFIAAVSNLRELNWVRALRFPQEVLDALHKYHPSCKLNLLYFYLQAWKYQGLSDKDMAVVTSPCLHSIRCYYYRNAGNDEVIESAILRSLSLAPNLKKVDLVLVPEIDFVDQRIYRFEPTDGASNTVARLETLSFSLNSAMSVQRFDQWRQKTDIGHLRTLSIGRLDEPALARTICAVAPSFQRLERLSLNLRVTPRRSLEYWRSVEEMMKALPPLKGLWLVGNRNASFISRVLARHGATLESLGLDSRNIQHDVQTQRQTRPYYNAQEIARFANKCPVLRELHLTVHRVQGLAPEVQVYKALGRFPALVHLCVKLDYFPSAGDPHDNVDPSTIPDSLTRYEPAKVWEARALYINAVIDDRLAESIFNTILSSQSTRRLASLRLLPTPELQPQAPPLCVPDPYHTHFLHNLAATRSANSEPGVLDIKRTRTALDCPVGEVAPFSMYGWYYILKWIWPNDITSFPLQDV
ncbi:conserved hypothetical protein [Aspergillus lentulus]|uniref:F-box domain-containing protein n=1 Tax=Aspergillus lentulus TaxID=293939 RepID=A0ABQ1A8Q0_ASPLE|nr:conserved hypothetical protein [Aspergillus lentulus]KAF4152211.1 hypothetical protein CNMCM6069_002455 [Aspergillus lentulus]KAF4188147.1 hypothetical protein CNMCM7927_002639 [Aspergillus lentulus]GFF32011.1 conserved hypothetical protein [Aspergillus lentulus]GFF58579.1 conserved hypothetical protein [Aspergillus lentulus]GFF76257.1 conserved hypothetical protein [Aspergillus lentulus]